jgi:hypothetical protein
VESSVEVTALETKKGETCGRDCFLLLSNNPLIKMFFPSRNKDAMIHVMAEDEEDNDDDDELERHDDSTSSSSTTTTTETSSIVDGDHHDALEEE